MARMIIELTNRCNLRCGHCYEERHAATADLPLALLEHVLGQAKGLKIDHLCFTGGEPTVHRRFRTLIRRVCEAGYTFSFVSNGMNFTKVYPLLLKYRDWFKGITFSLDGASESTHDRLRGKGSYRRVMRAASICVVKDLPFTFNMVLTAKNRGEVNAMVSLAQRLGSRGVRFGHLMFTPETSERGLNLSPQERREVETEIWDLQKTARVPVGMAPGHFNASPFFPCAPLECEEYNLDYRGNLTLCCHLSGYAGVNAGTDVMGNLNEVSLEEACGRFRERVAAYLADKQARLDRAELSELDHFPCWYCVKYLGKVPWLEHSPEHPWAEVGPQPFSRTINVAFGANRSTAS